MKPKKDWQELTTMSAGSPLVVERVRLTDREIRIEGDFELPPLARLSAEDQVFTAAFLHAHGSIKEMERLFGISYPTVKNRLNAIAAQLEFTEVKTQVASPAASPKAAARERSEVLERLKTGKISVREALESLK